MTIAVALVPPRWHRPLTPGLLARDRDHASAEASGLPREANLRSGHPAPVRAAGE